MIKILIADDHTMFREGLRRLLEAESGMTVAGEAATGPEALDAAVRNPPDVVLLDVRMPGRGGLETLQELKRRQPRLRVLMLTQEPENHYAIRCLRSGADGYVTKDRASDELVTAIRKVCTGGKYISPSLAEQLAFNLDQDTDRPPHEALSDREFQVMSMIATGKTVSEIGEELCLSVKTISTYRTRILQKMNLRNNAEIMHYAMQRGLTE